MIKCEGAAQTFLTSQNGLGCEFIRYYVVDGKSVYCYGTVRVDVVG